MSCRHYRPLDFRNDPVIVSYIIVIGQLLNNCKGQEVPSSCFVATLFLYILFILSGFCKLLPLDHKYCTFGPTNFGRRIIHPKNTLKAIERFLISFTISNWICSMYASHDPYAISRLNVNRPSHTTHFVPVIVIVVSIEWHRKYVKFPASRRKMVTSSLFFRAVATTPYDCTFVQ